MLTDYQRIDRQLADAGRNKWLRVTREGSVLTDRKTGVEFYFTLDGECTGTNRRWRGWLLLALGF